MSSLYEAWRLLTTDPGRILEPNGQLTIFFQSDEPPEPDEHESLEDYLQAWKAWERQYPALAKAVEAVSSSQKFMIRLLDKTTLSTEFIQLGWCSKAEAIAKFKDYCHRSDLEGLLVDLVQDAGACCVQVHEGLLPVRYRSNNETQN